VTGATAAERAELRELARELARRELQPQAAALDSADAATLTACWRELATVGLDRALLGEEDGGPGLGVAELLTVLEELAVGDGGVALCVLLSNAALLTLDAEQRAAVPEGARWAIVAARVGGELTISERQISGHVACALGAHEADGIVLLLQGAKPSSIILDAATPGIALEREPAQMGLRAAAAASLTLSEVATGPAPASDGADGGAPVDFDRELGSALALLRAGTASIARGVTRRAYAMALQYAHERQQGGVPIIEHDAVTDMLATIAVWLACPLPLATTTRQALALKIAATEAAVAATTDAVQVFGGTGYMHETGVEKLMRDAKYCQLYPEPNWMAQDELVHLQHIDDLDLLAWAGAAAAVPS
jgi:alkylation response protein AidB-like acyl-CoA dehydrogenase